ncbi:hypothetical protein GCM10010124_13970 [Pilimelia terevasa]|uniref:Uncharacterized protein n=1 Tax=Pilimelia terevasa TaxID=53372 RepID=A0A8J3BIY0_9ACTN|nr:hypothetical protein [Pilimelia terevasa]GGK22657.1 hypothetical protein GCM10010124_13970 [Pilimelia terevasa]
MTETAAAELHRVDAIVESLLAVDATEYGTQALSMTQATFSDTQG